MIVATAAAAEDENLKCQQRIDCFQHFDFFIVLKKRLQNSDI
jgi:hypothetical protein